MSQSSVQSEPDGAGDGGRTKTGVIAGRFTGAFGFRGFGLMTGLAGLGSSLETFGTLGFFFLSLFGTECTITSFSNSMSPSMFDVNVVGG